MNTKYHLIAVLFFTSLLSACAGNSTGPEMKGAAGMEVRKAVFDIRHELIVKVPEGAKRLRLWFALP